jgi:hypothetical protein
MSWLGHLTSIRPARALPSAVNGSAACRPPLPLNESERILPLLLKKVLPMSSVHLLPMCPVYTPLQGWLFQQPRPERHLHVRVPALSMTRTRSLRGYFTYELLRNSTARLFLLGSNRSGRSIPVRLVNSET